MKVIYSGLESSGKSLKLAMVSSEILHRNIKWLNKSGIARPIYSNLRFSDDFYNYALASGIKINYWENLDDLILVRDADVIIDEVGTYFDSRLWADLSLEVRRWIAQAAKSGVEIYGTAQDFAQVDKSFRRLVNELYYIRKIVGSRRPSATKPPVKRIWGICQVVELDPRTYDEDEDKFAQATLFSLNFFLIERKYCEIFDTRQFIKKSQPPALKHIERYCEHRHDDVTPCHYHKVQHV